MKYIKINIRKILFFLILLLPEQFIHLVNHDHFYIMTHINYSDFVILIYFCLFMYMLYHYKINDLRQYYYANNMLMIVPLTIIAAVVPHFLFGQSIISAFLVQRRFIMLICGYYLARTAIINNIISKDYLWKCIYGLSFVITGFFIIQHAISNYVRILDVFYTERFGVRITENNTYSFVLLIGSLILYCKTTDKKERILACLGLIMAYYHCVFVDQTRIVMAAYGIVTVLLIVLIDKKMSKKAIYLFLVFGIVLWMLESDLGQYFISAIMDTSSDPSARIRAIGKELYISELIKSPLVGRGYPYNDEAYKAAGIYDLIYLNDNGIYGFTYIYGLFGLAWYIWLSIKMFICSIKALKECDYKYVLYTVYLQVICANIIWWYWYFSFGLIFTIMLAMMEDYNSAKNIPKISLYFEK